MHMFAVKFVAEAKRRSSLSGPQIMLHGQIFENVCQTAVSQIFEKLFESNSCYHVVLRDYSSTFTYQYIGRYAS